MLRTSQSSRRSAIWLAAAIAALGIGVLAPSAHAADIIQFNPVGNGVNATNTVNTSGFTWYQGNVLTQGSNTAIEAFFTSGAQIPFNVYYQAILSSASGTTAAGLSLTSTVPPTTDETPNVGSTQLSDGASGFFTGNAFTVVVSFQEIVTGGAIGGGSGDSSAIFDLVPGSGGFQIFAVAPGSAENFAGTGFNPGTPILAGNVIPSGFGSSFAGSFGQTGPSGPVVPAPTAAFDQYASPSLGEAAFYAGITTVLGTGSTNAQFTVTSSNPSYFPGTVPIGVTFNPVANATPFNVAAPSKRFVNVAGVVAIPNLGTVNGGNIFNGYPLNSGDDFEFQSLAPTAFFAQQVVPEPGTISLAAAGIGILVLGALRRRTKPSAV